jgi:hypothetical protein
METKMIINKVLSLKLGYFYKEGQGHFLSGWLIYQLILKIESKLDRHYQHLRFKGWWS